MSRKLFAAWVVGSLFSIATSSMAPQAQADWNDFWHTVHVDYHRANEWPHPFRTIDSQSVRAPFEVMKNNGWRAYNTIGEPLFDSTTNSLTPAGRRQVHWIMTQAPQHRRVVFVLKAETPQQTAERVAAVQQTVNQLQAGGAPVGVYVTDIVPHRSPGQYQTAISRSLMNTIPAPRLPSFNGLSTPDSGAASNAAPTGGSE